MHQGDSFHAWPTTCTDEAIDIRNYEHLFVSSTRQVGHTFFSLQGPYVSWSTHEWAITMYALPTLHLTLPTHEPSQTWTQHIKQNIYPNQKRPKFRILSLNPPPLTTQSYDRPFQFRANTTKVSPNNPGIEKEERMACFPPSQLYTWQKRHLVRFSRKKKSKKQGGPPGWAEVGCVCVVCCV